MARVKYGALITDMKGKIGGTVFQGGYAGPVAKKLWGYIMGPSNSGYDTPSGPRAQAHVRARVRQNTKHQIWALVSQQWRELTDAQRDAWKSASPSFPAKNKFGDTYTPSGYQLWMQLNVIAVGFGDGLILVPPTPAIFPDITGSSITLLDTANFAVTMNALVTDDWKIEFLATAPFSKGANLSRGGVKFIAIKTGTGSTPIQLFDDYTGTFMAPILDTRINLSYRIIEPTSGQASAWYSLTGTVVEA